MPDSQRSSWAEVALIAYGAAKYEDVGDEADFRDLLADLMHLARARGLDFEDELRIAAGHFDEEAGRGPIPAGHKRLTLCLVSNQPVSVTGSIDIPEGTDAASLDGERLYRLLVEQNPGIDWVAGDAPEGIGVGWIDAAKQS